MFPFLSKRLAKSISKSGPAAVEMPVARDVYPDTLSHDAGNIVKLSNKTILRIWSFFFVLGFIFIACLLALKQMAPALVLIFTAFFLALALNAPVQWIAQRLPGSRRGDRNLATIISVFVVFVALGGFLASVVPSFARQITGLVESAPAFVNDLSNENSEVGRLIQRYNLQGQVDSFSADLGKRLRDASGAAVSVVGGIASSAFAVLTIIVLTFMMLTEGPRWVRTFGQLVPASKRAHTRELSRAMYKVVKGYVNGQVTLAAIAAALILPMLLILGIGYPIALMVIVFICGLIPMVGHLIGAVLVTTVALFTSPIAAVTILGYYFLYQQIENYWIQPKIQSNSTNMSPLLVFIAVVLGVNFGGLLGGLVAIPIMGCIRILVLDQLTRRNILDSRAARSTVADAKTVG